MVMHSSIDDSMCVQSPGASSGQAAPRDQRVLLPPDFVPGERDVLCQRGKDCFEHVGNKRFRVCIDKFIETYLSATTRLEKSSIVSNIVDAVRGDDNQSNGEFVKKDLLTRRWYKISEKDARGKVGQALRDAIKIIRSSGKSTTKSKSPSSEKEVRAEHQRSDLQTNTRVVGGAAPPGMVKTPIVGNYPSEVSKIAPFHEAIDVTHRSSTTEKKCSLLSHQATPPPQLSFLGQGMLETRIEPLGLPVRQHQDEGNERKEQWSNASELHSSFMDNKGVAVIPDNSLEQEHNNLGKRSFQMMTSHLYGDPHLADVMENDTRRSRRRSSMLRGYSMSSQEDFFPFDAGQTQTAFSSRGESLLSQAAASCQISLQAAQLGISSSQDMMPSLHHHHQQPINMLQMDQFQNWRASYPSIGFTEPPQKVDRHFGSDIWGDLEPNPLPNPDFQIDLTRTS